MPSLERVVIGCWVGGGRGARGVWMAGAAGAPETSGREGAMLVAASVAGTDSVAAAMVASVAAIGVGLGKGLLRW